MQNCSLCIMQPNFKCYNCDTVCCEECYKYCCDCNKFLCNSCVIPLTTRKAKVCILCVIICNICKTHNGDLEMTYCSVCGGFYCIKCIRIMLSILASYGIFNACYLCHTVNELVLEYDFHKCKIKHFMFKTKKIKFICDIDNYVNICHVVFIL